MNPRKPFCAISLNNLQGDAGLSIFNRVHPAPLIRQGRCAMHGAKEGFQSPEKN